MHLIYDYHGVDGNNINYYGRLTHAYKDIGIAVKYRSNVLHVKFDNETRPHILCY